MNDRERFYSLMRELHTVTEHSRRSVIAAMDDIIRRNQNGPPHGHADGSFSPAQWTIARDLIYAIENFNTAWRKALALAAPDLMAAAPPDRDGFIDDDLPF
jgi:hypothetical protein